MNRYEDRSASEETEDLGFLSTQVYETLTSGKEEPKAPMSETQVLETMTRRGEEAKEAPEEAEETEEEEETSWTETAAGEVLLFFRDLGICMALVLIMINFVIRPIQVRGSSMYPTLQNGSLGVSNRLG